jgi:hypothetical protein
MFKGIDGTNPGLACNLTRAHYSSSTLILSSIYSVVITCYHTASLVSCSRVLMVQMLARHAILHAPILVHIDPLNHLFGCHNLLAPASLVSCSRVLMVQMLARHTILRLVLSLSCSLSVCVTLPSVCSVVWPVFESS